MTIFDQPLHILVIEDNPGDFLLVEDYLQEQIPNLQIVQAKRYDKALQVLKEEDFDLVLLDLTLPDHSGAELVGDVMEAANNVPVIVLTGYTDAEFGVKTLSLGVSDYLLKDELNALLLKKSIYYSIERHRIYRSLEDSEKEYRDLFNLNPIPAFVFRLETSEILNINRAAIDNYGYTREEFQSMNLYDLRPEQDFDHLDSTLRELRSDVDVRIATYSRHLKKSGELISVEIRSKRIVYQGEKAVLALANDVTEQLEQEVRLKESLERYDIVSRATSDAIWDFEIQRGEIVPNDVFYRIFGYHEEDVSPEVAWWDRKIHPEDRVRVREMFVRAVEENRDRFQMEYRFRCADGTYRSIFDRVFMVRSSDGEPLRIIGAMQDVTKRKEEEDRLRLLESVITNTREGVVILEAEPTRLPGRRIVYVNDGFSKMSGYTKEDVLGRTLHFLSGPATDQQEIEKLGRSLEKWKACHVELINYKRSGESFWTSLSMVPVKDSKGEYTHWISIARDVTERKTQEQAIRESLKEKDILLAEIHHRVKNNLAVISAMLQLQASEDGNEELSDKLYDSITRIKAIANIHEHLYKSNTFSRLDFSENTRTLIDNVVSSVPIGAEVGIEYEMEPIILNVNQAIPCSLIVNEVVMNSLKHAFKGRSDGIINVRLSLNGKNLTLEIADNGIGFPEGVDLPKSGSLGYQIISVLSQQLGAEKQYESGSGGTRFTLQFTMNDIRGVGNARLM
ncbi:MAG: PAS domain S-box protein [Balneolaceae bacterium]